MTDDLPDCLTGVMVSSTDGTFNVGPGNTVTGSIPTLAVGSPVTITITATVPAGCGPTITNQARIDAAGDTSLANNTSAVVTTSVTTGATCSLSPATDTNPVNTSHTVTATVTQCGVPVTGAAQWQDKYRKIAAPDHWPNGCPVPFPKQAWKEAALAMSPNEARAYFETWAAVGATDLRRGLAEGTVVHWPLLRRTLGR